MATTSASCSSKYDSSSDITDFELEDNTAGELPSELTCLTENYDSENDEIPYSDEPLADAEWISQYDKEVKQIEEQESELKSRLAGTVLVSSWCKCGNCSVALLQNISECYCCDELDGCGEALQSDLVQDDVGEKELRCITDHPGFQPVCLEKWSLRLAADRYNTKSKTRYRQTGSENE